MTAIIYEVLERIQPHAMGWPDPPPESHGLFVARADAQAKINELADPHHQPYPIRSTHITERTVTGPSVDHAHDVAIYEVLAAADEWYDDPTPKTAARLVRAVHDWRAVHPA